MTIKHPKYHPTACCIKTIHNANTKYATRLTVHGIKCCIKEYYAQPKLYIQHVSICV